MFTSRAEYRILLRQDNADFRLTEKGFNIGLATKERFDLMKEKYAVISEISSYLDEAKVSPAKANRQLKKIGTSPIDEGKKISALLIRPDVTLEGLLPIVPQRTIITKRLKEFCKSNNRVISEGLAKEILDSTEVAIKYRGYIVREQAMADKMHRLENIKIPQTFDFNKVTSLSFECRQKLIRYRPATIAQASRISGVSPADISVLLVYFGR